MKEVYPDRWEKYWNRITEEEVTFELCKGEPVKDFPSLDGILNNLYERTRLLQNALEYKIEVPAIKLCQLSPFANLMMEILKMLKIEKNTKGDQKLLQMKNTDSYVQRHDLLRYLCQKR